MSRGQSKFKTFVININDIKSGVAILNKTNFYTGKIGEYICAARLTQIGVSCEIVNLKTTDIIAEYEFGFLRIQVKTSSLKKHGNYYSYQFLTVTGGKKKPLLKEHCDIIALVALEHERVLFKPVEYFENKQTKRIPPKKFDEKNLEIKSWNNCLNFL